MAEDNIAKRRALKKLKITLLTKIVDIEAELMSVDAKLKEEEHEQNKFRRDPPTGH